MYGYCEDTSHNHCEHSYLRAASFVSLKAVAHWTPKGLTIFYQNSSKSVTKSVGSFFRGGGGSMENVNMYLKSSEMYRFGTFLVAHTNKGKNSR